MTAVYCAILFWSIADTQAGPGRRLRHLLHIRPMKGDSDCALVVALRRRMCDYE